MIVLQTTGNIVKLCCDWSQFVCSQLFDKTRIDDNKIINFSVNNNPAKFRNQQTLRVRPITKRSSREYAIVALTCTEKPAGALSWRNQVSTTPVLKNIIPQTEQPNKPWLFIKFSRISCIFIPPDTVKMVIAVARRFDIRDMILDIGELWPKHLDASDPKADILNAWLRRIKIPLDCRYSFTLFKKETDNFLLVILT